MDAPRSTRARSAHTSAPAAGAHLVRSSTWAGLRTGAPVEVAGVRGRASTWTFLAHVHNERTGEEWVEVVGGRPGSRAVRSFRPEQIFSPSGRPQAGARPSLAEAPQLPL